MKEEQKQKFTPKQIIVGTFLYVLSKFTGGLLDVGAVLFETLTLSFLVWVVYNSLDLVFVPFVAFWTVFSTIQFFRR